MLLPKLVFPYRFNFVYTTLWWEGGILNEWVLRTGIITTYLVLR